MVKILFYSLLNTIFISYALTAWSAVPDGALVEGVACVTALEFGKLFLVTEEQTKKEVNAAIIQTPEGAVFVMGDFDVYPPAALLREVAKRENVTMLDLFLDWQGEVLLNVSLAKPGEWEVKKFTSGTDFFNTYSGEKSADPLQALKDLMRLMPTGNLQSFEKASEVSYQPGKKWHVTDELNEREQIPSISRLTSDITAFLLSTSSVLGKDLGTASKEHLRLDLVDEKKILSRILAGIEYFRSRGVAFKDPKLAGYKSAQRYLAINSKTQADNPQARNPQNVQNLTDYFNSVSAELLKFAAERKNDFYMVSLKTD